MGIDTESEQSRVGLIGGLCSGKNNYGDYLVTQYGSGSVVSSSDAAREFIASHELGEPTRALTSDTATMLRATHGETYLAEWALNELEGESFGVIAGLYVPAEVEYIQSIGGIVVGIEVAGDIRRQRMSQRLRAGEEASSDFSVLDSRDMFGDGADQRLDVAFRLTDVVMTINALDSPEEQYQLVAGEIWNLLGVSVQQDGGMV